LSLKEYKAKRNFRQTAEPAGETTRTRKRGGNTFVVQKHDATRLHYDFRLEMDRVLKSWAVPKGFPTKRGDRRLAVQVEDHPIEYGGFEGTIPEGSYGAGTVMLWDSGAYEVSGLDPSRALRDGKLHLILHGKKLKGEWTLVRMRPREGNDEDKPQWLLLKSGRDIPPISKLAEDHSVLSGRSLEQIASARDREWQSDRPSRGKKAVELFAARPASPNGRAGRAASVLPLPNGEGRGEGEGTVRQPTAHDSSHRISQSSVHGVQATTPPAAKINLHRLPKKKPGFVEPMKALLVDELPKRPDWIYEIKFDGVRALAIKNHREVELISRSGKELGSKYDELLEPLKKLPVRQVVLDGEIVALDEQGRSSFQLLQSYQMAGVKKPPLFYYVFDLINLDGKELTSVPLFQRKAMAESLLANNSSVIRFSPGIKADSTRLMREMKARGLEGLVAKCRDSKYEPGRRSGAWVKFKWTNEQEFVICGYTEPKGTRTHFGALLVGYYEKNNLFFAAKVGTGFDQRLLVSLYNKFKKLVRPDCPFANLPEKLTGRWGQGLSAAEMRRCTWLQPKLVCQVRFAEWTRDDHLRQPAFLGLREDKHPIEVVREKAK
jgi:bifunctional non-homologous end joining protein LigD